MFDIKGLNYKLADKQYLLRPENQSTNFGGRLAVIRCPRKHGLWEIDTINLMRNVHHTLLLSG